MHLYSSLICSDDSTNGFTICISCNKSIFSFGKDNTGALGHEEGKISSPKEINNLFDIKMIAAGITHIICLNYNGDIFSFGDNGEGQLGINKDKEVLFCTHLPNEIILPVSCTQISCGYNFTICVTEDSTLYSFGGNYFGQLGLGKNTEYYTSPQLIPDFNNIELIECGAYHAICKTYNNEFYSWGYNYFGELGIGKNTVTSNACNKPIQCKNWPDNIISIKCGGHSLLLTLEGQIYSFGDNSSGQLGLGLTDENFTSIHTPTLINNIPEIQRIECGDNHSMCIDINDNLWIFGNNQYGQLGFGDKKCRYKPNLHPTLSNIIDISSGGDHTFVKTIDNKIYAFGRNNYLQLGIKTSEKNQLTPIQVLEGKEDIWCSTIGKSKQKSARK